MPAGELAEYASACGVSDGIPIDIFEKDRPAPIEHRADAATVAPATGTGATLAPIQPFVFSKSIAPMLGIEMPTVGSGAYSEATITTKLTAVAKAKGAAQESTAAVLTPATATPRRISARLTLNVEDVAAIGQANFESALRDNLSMSLSDQYDLQCVRGDGVAPNIDGLIAQLTNPTDPTEIATFDAFLKAFSDQIDGLWASKLSEVSLITNADATSSARRSSGTRQPTWAASALPTTPCSTRAGGAVTRGCRRRPATSRAPSSTAWASRGCEQPPIRCGRHSRSMTSTPTAAAGNVTSRCIYLSGPK